MAIDDNDVVMILRLWMQQSNSRDDDERIWNRL